MEQSKARKRVERIVWELGGPVELAKAVGAHRTTAYRWVQENSIPARWQPAVLEVARKIGAPVTAEDLIGR